MFGALQEEFGMISDAGAAIAATRPFPFAACAAATVVTPVPTEPPCAETAEQEIMRLTWSVLDGSATLNDRQRLAELVNAQHSRRHRFDP